MRSFKKVKKIGKIQISLILIFAAVLLYCGIRALIIYNEYGKADKVYASARAELFEVRQIRETPAQTQVPAEPILEVDFAKLRQQSADAFGWLWIPDTNVSYPVVQSSDNEKYLYYTFDGEKNGSGAIFMDARCLRDMSGRHTIIYGHNMRGGSMFGQLSQFDDQSYFDSHPYIYIITEEEVFKYKIFSQYITSATPDSYQLDFESGDQFDGYLNRLQRLSRQVSDWAPGEDNRVLTLSTCVNDNAKRRVIHAGLTG
ncbi:MAG: class B sortase [Clostridiales bacterium]|jgi:sortase B|nr:class B sortase [Clostridiales bacterium]MDR3239330.1 class B sortase [Clostridiales bacterium]